MNILVAGANGFVGRNLTKALKCIRDGKDRTHLELSIGKETAMMLIPGWTSRMCTASRLGRICSLSMLVRLISKCWFTVFLTCVNGAALFDLDFGGREGYVLGTLKLNEGYVSVGIKSYEVDP